MDVTFRSKIDWWLLVVLIIAAAGSIIVVISMAITQSLVVALLTLPLLLPTVVLPVWLLAATNYTIRAEDLHVRSGPFAWRIPLHEIRSVSRTRNPLSSPALSLDRLRIEYGKGRSIMISPKDKENFLNELRKRVPAL
jgi:hypothetical protein